MSPPRILVTGAGGFIGDAVARAFQEAGARRVRAGVTRLRLSGGPEGAVVCDMFDPESLAAALTGAEVVVHCARAADHARAAEGDRRVLLAAQAAGVRRFIHMSSVAVYGDARGEVGEDTPPAGSLTPYARAKLASESECRSAASAAMSVAVIRPALVYGPGSDLWTTAYVRRLASGRWRRLGAAGEGRANLVHVDDLAALAVFLATGDFGDFALFNANGPETPTWNQYLDLFSDALGVARPVGAQSTSLALAALRRPFKVVEKRLLRLRPGAAEGGGLVGRAFRALRDDVTLPPSYQELALYRQDAVYAMEAAARIGFRPAIDLRQGLADCAAWARRSGLL